VKFTFDEASNSAASDNEIQSDGGFDIGQSASFAAVSAAGALSVSPVDGFAASLELALFSPLPARSDLEPLDRSLRAQPLPLKCTAAAATAFLIGPPQLVQTVGPCPWTGCVTSIRRPQLVQT
jgi:hypothetical protein